MHKTEIVSEREHFRYRKTGSKMPLRSERTRKTEQPSHPRMVHGLRHKERTEPRTLRRVAEQPDKAKLEMKTDTNDSWYLSMWFEHLGRDVHA